MAIDLSKQQKIVVDPKKIQKNNFTETLDKAEGATIFFNT